MNDMKNEIIFRGKSKESGEWVYGFYCPVCCGSFPCDPAIVSKEKLENGCWEPEKIFFETLGQYTGIKDKNGEMIFCGDIVIAYDIMGEIRKTGTVDWSNLFSGWHIEGTVTMYGGNLAYYEILGNVCEPENGRLTTAHR